MTSGGRKEAEKRRARCMRAGPLLPDFMTTPAAYRYASFGVNPMIWIPAPLATSMASITSW
jgi:hypothetical protein